MKQKVFEVLDLINRYEWSEGWGIQNEMNTGMFFCSDDANRFEHIFHGTVIYVYNANVGDSSPVFPDADYQLKDSNDNVISIYLCD